MLCHEEVFTINQTVSLFPANDKTPKLKLNLEYWDGVCFVKFNVLFTLLGSLTDLLKLQPRQACHLIMHSKPAVILKFTNQASMS